MATRNTTHTGTTTRPTRNVRLLAALIALVGLTMTIGGAVAWTMTANQLAEQHMTVAPYSETHPGKYAGQAIDGPITAWAQADVINTHALEATDGKTYAQMDREDPVRAVAMDGALLRGALFTSVLAFGVAFMAGGVGLVLLLAAAALAMVTKAPATQVEEVAARTGHGTGMVHAAA